MAKYKNKTVKLNKPMRGDVKKFKVFVKNRKTGRVVKVNFGDKKLSIKKNIPARKRSFMARFRPILAKAKRSGKQLNTPMRGDVKKFKVFVKDRSSGRVKKVNFGSKEMSIKKHIPARKRSFMARMGGVLKKVRGQKTLSPAYWSIRAWQKGFKV
jgi:hypothetical protein